MLSEPVNCLCSYRIAPFEKQTVLLHGKTEKQVTGENKISVYVYNDFGRFDKSIVNYIVKRNHAMQRVINCKIEITNLICSNAVEKFNPIG